jgi:hypothetical protein
MKVQRVIAGNDRKNVIRICSVCHRIIDKQEALARIEACAKEYSGMKFSHGLCPTCFQLEMVKIEAYPFEKVKLDC